MSQILFIGEKASKTGDGKPLTGNSGKFLAELCGQFHEEFLNEHRCCNLFNEDDSLAESPSTILCWSDIKLIVLLGDKVTEAFHGWLPQNPERYKIYFEKSMYGDIKAIMSMPHPSHKNLHWNLEAHVEQAKIILGTCRYLFR